MLYMYELWWSQSVLFRWSFKIVWSNITYSLELEKGMKKCCCVLSLFLWSKSKIMTGSERQKLSSKALLCSSFLRFKKYCVPGNSYEFLIDPGQATFASLQTFKSCSHFNQLSSNSWYFECPSCVQTPIQKYWNIKCPTLSQIRVLIHQDACAS